MGCVVTPIVGRPRPLSRHRHAQTTGTCLYTLICEEPINFTKSSVDHIRDDNEKWQAEVAPIVGKTDMLIYPFGADIAGAQAYGNEKFQYLKGQGFNAFFNVDASVPAWGQAGPNYLREARINVDGISLKHAIEGTSETLNEFFDPHLVLDPQRPKTIAGTE